jgi:hypothetical protein
MVIDPYRYPPLYGEPIAVALMCKRCGCTQGKLSVHIQFSGTGKTEEVIAKIECRACGKYQRSDRHLLAASAVKQVKERW